jgi:hypothetical protein
MVGGLLFEACPVSPHSVTGLFLEVSGVLGIGPPPILIAADTPFL